jgi:hypothetical protein
LTDVLERKIRQMHAALDAIGTDDLTVATVKLDLHGVSGTSSVDFSGGATDVELHNQASLLIASIASIKDHLKDWCARNGRPFGGDALINRSRAVAIIHDLWNVDKHATLTSKPRSGSVPRLTDLHRALRMSSGTQPGVVSVFSFNPLTSEVQTGTGPDGSSRITLIASIVDENGAALGDFEEICELAVSDWRAELVASGVAVPTDVLLHRGALTSACASRSASSCGAW